MPIVYLTVDGLVFEIEEFSPDEKGVSRPVLKHKPLGRLVKRDLREGGDIKKVRELRCDDG